MNFCFFSLLQLFSSHPICLIFPYTDKFCYWSSTKYNACTTQHNRIAAAAAAAAATSSCYVMQDLKDRQSGSEMRKDQRCLSCSRATRDDTLMYMPPISLMYSGEDENIRELFPFFSSHPHLLDSHKQLTYFTLPHMKIRFSFSISVTRKIYSLTTHFPPSLMPKSIIENSSLTPVHPDSHNTLDVEKRYLTK
jgi:hypothetical protein